MSDSPSCAAPTKPVVAFYAFKGGVGRTTALAFVARRLAERGTRVACIDLDLESPGLSALLTGTDRDAPGVVDFIREFEDPRRFGHEDVTRIPIDRFVREVRKDQLYLVGAGRLGEEYVATLEKIRVREFFLRPAPLNPLLQIVAALRKRYDPQVILVDSRTGVSDLSAIGVLGLADNVLLFFRPNAQNRDGLALALRFLARNHAAGKGRPRIRLVMTQLASDEPNTLPEEERIQKDRVEGLLGSLLWKALGDGVDEYPCVPFHKRLLRLDWIRADRDVAGIDAFDGLAQLVGRWAGVKPKKPKVRRSLMPPLVAVGLARSALDRKDLRMARRFLAEGRKSLLRTGTKKQSWPQRISLDLMSTEAAIASGRRISGRRVARQLEAAIKRKAPESSKGRAYFEMAMGLGRIGDRLGVLGSHDDPGEWYSQAVDAYRQAMKMDPGNSAAAYNCAIDLESWAQVSEPPDRERLFREAFEKYELAVKVKPDKHEAWNNWGNALSDLAKESASPEQERLFREAFEKYELAVKVKPDKHEAWYNWGNALSDLAKESASPEQERLFREAFEKYEHAVKVKPDKHEAWNNWGVALSDLAEKSASPEQERLFREAFEKYEHAVKVKPDKHEAWYNWGIALSNLAEKSASPEQERLFREAFEKFGRAVELNPNSADTWEAWALAVEFRGNAVGRGRQRDAALAEAEEKRVRARALRAGASGTSRPKVQRKPVEPEIPDMG